MKVHMEVLMSQASPLLISLGKSEKRNVRNVELINYYHQLPPGACDPHHTFSSMSIVISDRKEDLALGL